jgi:hypothetical protein
VKRTHKAWGMLGAVLALALAVGCKSRSGPNPKNYFAAEGTPLLLPRAPGWVRDSNVSAPDGSGGTVLRLVRESSVAGSPRIEVVLEPTKPVPTVLEDFLTRNLRDMGQLEANGRIRILHVEQRRVSIGDVPAYRVNHEYTTGGGTAQVSLYQESTFVVLDGRGITITAAGRTELFHPLAESVERILDGVILAPGARAAAEEIKPLDLGRVGGRKR